MGIPTWLQRILEHYHVPYEVHRHAPVFSASRLAAAEHVTGYRVAKTVLVNAHGRPLSVVLPACARLDADSLRAVTGEGDVRLASESEIGGWFRGCAPGTVPPLRLRSGQSVLMDRGMAHLGKIVFPAGSQEISVAVRFRDWYRMIRPGVGRFTFGNRLGTHDQPAPSILVVEDEAVTNLMLCRLLERAGFLCHGAKDGSRALALASEVRPAAILLDLMLPDMSGFEVCEKLRRIGPLRSAPVIVLTALDDPDSRERGWQLGADAFLTKPIAPETLVAELNGILADARA